MLPWRGSITQSGEVTAFAPIDDLERLKRLQRVSDAALALLSVEELLDELLLRVRDILGTDTAAVLLLDTEKNELVARAAKGIEEEVERGVRIPVGKGFAGRIAAERQPVALTTVDHTTVVNPILFQKGIRSLLGVPLIAHGDVVGVLHIGTTTPRVFQQDEVELLQLVADRIALALQVRLAESTRVVIDAFQRTFLPDSLPYVPGLRVTTKYLPASSEVGIGGDWFDSFALPSGDLVLAIGDVAGHGLQAASLMGRMRNALRAYALLGGGASDIAERLDQYHRHFGDGELVTLLVGVLSKDISTFRFVLAGHCAPLVLGEGGAAFVKVDEHLPPLGVSRSKPFIEHALRIERGSMLLLYTDGLVERRGESLDVGLERLRRAVERSLPVHEAPQGITVLLEEQLEGSRPADDVAVLLLQRQAVPSLELDFAVPARARSLVDIRRAVTRWLDDLGVPTVTATEIVTAVSEASTNVIEHAYGLAGGTISITGDLQDEVVELKIRDTGTWRGSSRGGRGNGLRLIRRLMDDVALEPTDQGTAVWMRRKARS
jgi:serine phosphatase RsbU (regulator of sigma subunit)/anti-sigma regulatory factor (Ser/Thr protein kinase)